MSDVKVGMALARFCQPALEPGIPVEGLVAHYTMDDVSGSSLLDVSGNGNHGDINSGTFVPGLMGNAISFPGGSMGGNRYNNGVHLPGTVARDKIQFTVSAWIKGEGVILQTDWYSDANGWATGWAFVCGAEVLRFEKALSNRSEKVIRIPISRSLDEWAHVCAIVDHDDEVILFLNGSEAGRGDISGTRFYKGAHYANTGENIGSGYSASFTGQMDQFRVYSGLLDSRSVLALSKEASI